MLHIMTQRKATLLVALLGSLTLAGAAPAEEHPTAGQVEKMRAAMPEAPRVEPAEPRRVLVYTHCAGFRHKSIEVATAALEVMAEKTGAFTVDVTDDPAVFADEGFKAYDALVFNNTTGRFLQPRKLGELEPEAREAALEIEARGKRNLIDYVRGGGGIVGIHAASDAYYDWAEWGELIGAYFVNHPWTERVGVRVEHPDHPLSAAFAGHRDADGDIFVDDEIYQFRDEPYSRENLRVLLSLNTAKTDMTKDGIVREDRDFAVAWIREYGQGRVFYCSLGHKFKIFWDPVLLQFYLDGIQYALGDLEADATPSAALAGP